MQTLKRWRDRLKKVALSASLMGAAATVAPGCLDRPVERVEPRTTTTIVERLTQSSVDKIDLLLVIDNSRSMADKQDILNLAVPDLVNELINPACILEDGSEAATQPANPLEDCPDAASTREFDPIFDIHIGVITSSLGGHGADTCVPGMNGADASVNDQGRLIDRQMTGAMPGQVPTYQDLGFLVWDPDPMNPSHNPQGEQDSGNLVANLRSMVAGAGEVGCGFEATLEAWYRFLVDPNPFETIEIENSNAVLVGTDSALLQQRQNFLRPDSLLAIIMLSDENDCSIRDGGRFYFAAQSGSGQFRLPKATPACAVDPNDSCCRSCGETNIPPECDTSNCEPPNLAPADDALNLRCFDQKRRFGLDFLYPIQRYVDGLTAPDIPDREGSVVRNPLFSDLDPEDDNSTIRDAGLVFVAGIVGVPWQDIARKNGEGNPDLLAGLNSANEPVGGFQSADELEANGTWDVILGNPAEYVPPSDPLMVEQVEPRSGTNEATMTSLIQPNTNGDVGPVPNGAEYTVGTSRDDLQYACIFPLVGADFMPSPKDCTQPGVACDCPDDCDAMTTGAITDNPLCTDPAGAGTNYQCTQYRAKAYPGTRQLSVLRGAGPQGIVGSICPAQQTDAGLDNFGYRPAISAIVERLKQALGGQCLPRSLAVNNGTVPCTIIEARVTGEGQCESVCNEAGRTPLDPSSPAVQSALQDDLAATAGWNCFCEINQLQAQELDTCQNELSDNPVTPDGTPVDGWCYVDAATVPPTGEPDIVAECPATEKRIIRFVGNGRASSGATLFITCSGDSGS